MADMQTMTIPELVEGLREKAVKSTDLALSFTLGVLATRLEKSYAEGKADERIDWKRAGGDFVTLTRQRTGDDGPEYVPFVKFGVQQFDIASQGFEDSDDAEFICTQFRKAIARNNQRLVNEVLGIADKCYDPNPKSDTAYGVNVGVERVIKALGRAGYEQS